MHHKKYCVWSILGGNWRICHSHGKWIVLAVPPLFIFAKIWDHTRKFDIKSSTLPCRNYIENAWKLWKWWQCPRYPLKCKNSVSPPQFKRYALVIYSGLVEIICILRSQNMCILTDCYKNIVELLNIVFWHLRQQGRTLHPPPKNKAHKKDPARKCINC